MGRRLELLGWARETGAWVIEDDFDSELRYSGRPLASLQGLDDGERVIYVGTLNKVLFPGLRIGYAVVPPPLLRAFVNARHLMDRQPPSLSQIVVAEFMRQGHFAAHLRRMRLLYREQRDVLVDELTRGLGGHMTIDVPDHGMHLVGYLGDGTSDVDLEHAARERGVFVRALSRLYRNARPRPALMFGFTGFTCDMIAPAVARLAEVMERRSQVGRGTRPATARTRRGAASQIATAENVLPQIAIQNASV
jgi:GntR family transcriptional regulator/MocR family aminotransferase